MLLRRRCSTTTDRVALVEAALDMRIAAEHARRLRAAFARKLGLRKAHLTNSGSSANLLRGQRAHRARSWATGGCARATR